MVPRFPNFRHRSAARGRTNATPHPQKTGCPSGTRTPIARESTQGRNHLTAVANPCRTEDGSGYSHPRHLAALLQRAFAFSADIYQTHLSGILRRVVVFKYRDVSDFVLNSVTCVTIVITTTSRCRPTSLKKFGGQLGKVANEKRKPVNKLYSEIVLRNKYIGVTSTGEGRLNVLASA